VRASSLDHHFNTLSRMKTEILTFALLASLPVLAQTNRGGSGGPPKLGPDDKPAFPDPPAGFNAKRDNIPHGAVTLVEYDSKALGTRRQMRVYTPPGYSSDQKYPVLYLLHGLNSNNRQWLEGCRAANVMDNLLAEQKAVPMVMVIPNNQVVHRNHPRHTELTFKLFEAELRRHVIPLVEHEYSVRRTSKGRALSGLSMGGRHTMFVGFNSLDLFASFGVLSAGDVDAEKSLAKFLNDPDANQKIDYLFVGQGTLEAQGRMGERCVALHKALENHKITHEYYVGGHGGHDWATWRHLLYYRFLPNLWRKN